jgi:hypothetical protein
MGRRGGILIEQLSPAMMTGNPRDERKQCVSVDSVRSRFIGVVAVFNGCGATCEPAVGGQQRNRPPPVGGFASGNEVVIKPLPTHR